MRSSGSVFEFQPDRVIKRQDSEKTRSELERTQWGSQIGRKSGLFFVPSIISSDVVSGEIQFERLNGMQTLLDQLRMGRDAELLMCRVGCILAAIHSQSASGAGVTIHGDFSGENILYSPERDTLAVLDWSPAHWLAVSAQERTGSPCLDLATFLISIFYGRWRAAYTIPELERVARVFLYAYRDACSGAFKIDTLRAEFPLILRRFEATRRPRMSWLRVLAYKPSLRHLRHFIAALESRTASESYRTSHLAKGREYDATFSEFPHRAMQWRMEKRLLHQLVVELFPGRKPRFLDFACGTGRILAHLAPLTDSATGADVSASMLGMARQRVSCAEIVEGDLTREDPLGERRFELITAFRFFPNAEPELRYDAMEVLAGHLSPNGYLVFNNHKHDRSFARRVSGWLGRLPTRNHEGGGYVMSDAEVEYLVASMRLRIVRRYPIASLPFTDLHMLHPVWLLEALERLLTRLPASTRFAQNIVYVCTPETSPIGE